MIAGIAIGANASWSSSLRPGIRDFTVIQAVTDISAMTTVAAPAPSTVELTNARRVVSSANASLKFSTDRFDRLLTFDQVSGGTPLNGGWTAAQARMMIGRPMENSRISPAPPAASQRPTGPRSTRLGRNALPLITA